jgi:hypothetical protein
VPLRHAQESGYARHRPGRIVVKKVVAHEDQQLLAIEQLEPALELVGVQPSRHVAAAEAARHAGVRVRAQPLEHTWKLGLFAVQCLLERAGLTAPAQLHLEGGVGAIAVASGQAALHLAIATLMGAGAHIVASRALYGGSHNLLDYTLPRFIRDERELCSVPTFAAFVVSREVLHLPTRAV